MSSTDALGERSVVPSVSFPFNEGWYEEEVEVVVEEEGEEEV
jgi:hypothetical protein